MTKTYKFTVPAVIYIDVEADDEGTARLAADEMKEKVVDFLNGYGDSDSVGGVVYYEGVVNDVELIEVEE